MTAREHFALSHADITRLVIQVKISQDPRLLTPLELCSAAYDDSDGVDAYILWNRSSDAQRSLWDSEALRRVHHHLCVKITICV